MIDAYRGVYFGAPASGKADPSVVAAAELMVEMGRTFNDEDVLRSAIEQYRFLRKEYPGSKFRFDALFTVGEVYKDDLDDPAQAKVAFEEFIQRYPRHRLADDARQALAEISEETAKQHEKSKSSKSDSVAKRSDTTPDPKHREKTTRVTGIRHWSTPDYTRVAIDLEQDIKFDSQRIDNPDRIFFDLRDAKLASTLVGKSFEVDDGLLKKIRVAQFQPGRARVVLEVDGLSDYTAFLLPNPSRLIIDIHGKVGRQSARKLDNSGEKEGPMHSHPRRVRRLTTIPTSKKLRQRRRLMELRPRHPQTMLPKRSPLRAAQRPLEKSLPRRRLWLLTRMRMTTIPM